MFKKVFAVLLIGLVGITTGCSAKGTEVPEDYSFSLTWGVNGISSYDSSTGKLVKTSDATRPEEYVTTYKLTEEETEEIKELFNDLNLKDYPEEYDPYNKPNAEKKLLTCPSQDIILIVNLGDKTVEINALDIALADAEAGYNKDARKFLKTVEKIIEILEATDEWKALPEYEFYYD